MNKDKLDMVKQDTVRININILEISELKWTGMGKCSSDDNYAYYVGKNHLEEME